MKVAVREAQGKEARMSTDIEARLFLTMICSPFGSIRKRQHALGSDRFRMAIEAQLGRQAGPGIIGRPRKAKLD